LKSSRRVPRTVEASVPGAGSHVRQDESVLVRPGPRQPNSENEANERAIGSDGKSIENQ
jgi:hypothetical protein